VALGMKEDFSMYLDEIMRMINLAFEGSINLTLNNSDEDDLEYSENLREKLIECLTCLAHAFYQTNLEQKYIVHLPKVFSYLEKTCH